MDDDEKQERTMRGLLMALFAFDFPGHDAGRDRARVSTTKTTAKATTKTV